MPPIQSAFNKKQQRGFVGALARPNSHFMVERGQAGVELRPGDGVYFDASTDRWIKPVDTATRLLVTGVVTFETGLQSTLAGGVPAGANSDQELVFAVDGQIRVMTSGDIFVLAGAALERDQSLVFAQVDSDWVLAPAGNASAILNPRKTITCVDNAVADAGIAIVRLGSINY